MPQGGATFS